MAYGITSLARYDQKILSQVPLATRPPLQHRAVSTLANQLLLVSDQVTRSTCQSKVRRYRVTNHPEDVALSTPSRLTGLLTLTLLVLVLLSHAGCTDSTAHNEGQDRTQQVQLNGHDFQLELALDHAARHQGLSDRQEIAANGGMLFVFPMPSHLQFVMRRCFVPIDLIYLDPAGRVLALHRMKVEPYDTPESRLTRYASPWPAQFVIELRGGTLDTLDLKEGQQIALPLDHLKRLAR